MMKRAPALMRRMGRVKIRSRQASANQGVGERRSRVRGSGMEFEDYRSYEPGDNIRHLDRNAYLRSGQRFIKQFATYRQLPITLLLDASKSMGFGSADKLEFAKLVVAGLGYAAVAGGDRLRVGAFTSRLQWFPGFQGLKRLPHLFTWLDDLEANGSMTGPELSRALRPALVPEGLTIVVSDFMVEEFDKLLMGIQAQEQEIVGIHVLAPEEVDPGVLGSGELILFDSESGAEVEASTAPEVLELYRAELDNWMTQIRDRLHGGHGRYLMVTSDQEVDGLLTHRWRRDGLLG